MSLAAKGTAPPLAALAMALGANLGAALNPWFEGASDADPAAKRVPLGNLLNRAVGVAVALAFLPTISRFLVTIEPDKARLVADFHTAFNLALALIFMPLLTPFAALLKRLLPARVDPADPSRPLYLDPAAAAAPAIALGGAAREALRLADALEAMLAGMRDALANPDRRQIGETKRLDDVLDKLNSRDQGLSDRPRSRSVERSRSPPPARHPDLLDQSRAGRRHRRPRLARHGDEDGQARSRLLRIPGATSCCASSTG